MGPQHPFPGGTHRPHFCKSCSHSLISSEWAEGPASCRKKGEGELSTGDISSEEAADAEAGAGLGE